jgi:hypothetical protein
VSARQNHFAESEFRQGFQRSNREKIPANAYQLKVDGVLDQEAPDAGVKLHQALAILH